MHHGSISSAYVLSTTHPVACCTPTSVAPLWFQLQRITSNMESNRYLGFLQQSPNRIEIDMGWRPFARKPMRNPHCIETIVKAPLHFSQCQLWVLKRNCCNAHESIVDRAKIGHVSVVCTSRAVAKLVGNFATWRKWHVQAVRWKHELLLKTEHVTCNYAVMLIKCTKCLNLFHFCDHSITKCNQRIFMLVCVAGSIAHDHCHFFVCHNRATITDCWHLISYFGISKLLQKIG